jgi:hypothetical protein
MRTNWMCRRVSVLQRDVSEECVASVFRVEEITVANRLGAL